jgi:hypothetical protein
MGSPRRGWGSFRHGSTGSSHDVESGALGQVILDPRVGTSPRRHKVAERDLTRDQLIVLLNKICAQISLIFRSALEAARQEVVETRQHEEEANEQSCQDRVRISTTRLTCEWCWIMVRSSSDHQILIGMRVLCSYLTMSTVGNIRIFQRGDPKLLAALLQNDNLNYISMHVRVKQDKNG